MCMCTRHSSPATADPSHLHYLQMGFVEGALNLPVSSLRKRMGEVPEGKKLYVYCQVGTVWYCSYCRVLTYLAGSMGKDGRDDE